MKKISSRFASNHDYQLQPFAFVTHTHKNYIELDSPTLVEISSPIKFTGAIEFTGPVTGLPGGGSGQVDVFVTAGEAISALRILSSDTSGDGVYADPSDTESIRKLVGMSISGGATGSFIQMLNSGTYVDISWSFDVNLPLFLGPTGTIVQTAPVTGSSVVLGHAQTPTTIFLDIKRPIILA